MRAAVPTVIVLAYACYWVGLQFVGLEEEQFVGSGSLAIAGLFTLLALGIAFSRRFALVLTTLCAALVLFVLVAGVVWMTGTDGLIRAATCSQLRCAYEFWGAAAEGVS